MKVLIISGSSISKCNDFELKQINLTRSSKKHESSLYLLDSKNKTFYEVVKQTNELRSWFINDFVQEDGDIHFVTQVDPLFVLLPFISQSSTNFRSLYDILSESNDKSLTREVISCMIECAKADQLQLIADVKTISEEDFIKFNSEKTLGWLKNKVKNLCKSLKECNVSATACGSKVAGFTTGKEDKEESTDENIQLAFDIVKDYLDEDLANSLNKALGLNQVNVSPQAKQMKRKLNVNQSELGHIEYAQSRKLAIEANNFDKSNNPTRPKLTKSQNQLLKADKSGMKSISSFFKPKPK